MFRIVCHCRGCQAYARWLGRLELLDDAGGTDIVQLTPSQLRLETGVDQLDCVRLTDAGALRWHARCCRTPIANSLAQAWAPWLGMPRLFVDARQVGADALGPVRFRIHARHARAAVPGGHPTGPLSLILGTLGRSLRDAALGRARPHPLFLDGRPRVPARALTEAERAAIGLGASTQLVVRRAPARGCG